MFHNIVHFDSKELRVVVTIPDSVLHIHSDGVYHVAYIPVSSLPVLPFWSFSYCTDGFAASHVSFWFRVSGLSSLINLFTDVHVFLTCACIIMHSDWSAYERNISVKIHIQTFCTEKFLSLGTRIICFGHMFFPIFFFNAISIFIKC
jgi:hypothetical protein